MTLSEYDVLAETLADIGERGDISLRCMEHEPEVWETRMQVTCECLSKGGVLDNLERRHLEDELGETVYVRFPVQARSVLTVAHTLMDRGLFEEDELRAKMREVRERMSEV
ncbi:nitrile hydratase subunit beta [Actinomadura sp. WMMA1423]|uniref:nitrile hydratase subunit beta n=1 Tax=Actinomadura sp. WMMA1423 TaxID=2591108 RepID=UPI001146FADA|nr:nitrile hydratase subunit beta [Actinomadura sp. WMMA1423]